MTFTDAGGDVHTTVESLFRAYNFQLVQTGGGCTAYTFEKDDKTYWTITDIGGMHVPTTFEEYCMVGYHSPEGDEIICVDARTAIDALTLALLNTHGVIYP